MEYDHSRWIPYGIKVEWNDQNEWNPSQNIFHMEWMESTWNYMESIWNPYGFHVEYGGRVKTSGWLDVLDMTSRDSNDEEWTSDNLEMIAWTDGVYVGG